MTDKNKALISLILLSVLSGSTAAVMKLGIVSVPPLSFAFLRFLIAAIIILPFFIRKGSLKTIWKLLPFSVLGSLNIFFFVLGLKNTTATIAQLLYAFVPLLSALILYFLYKDRLSQKKTIGVFIGFIGVLMVVLLPLIEEGERFSGDLLGNLVVSFAVICWSFYLVLSKRKLESFSPFSITSAFIFTTCLLLSPFFAFEAIQNPNWWHQVTIPSVLSLVYVGTVSTIIIYLLNQYIVKHGGAIFAFIQFFLIPISAFLSAFVLLGEQLTVGLLIGGAVVLLGVYIATRGQTARI